MSAENLPELWPLHKVQNQALWVVCCGRSRTPPPGGVGGGAESRPEPLGGEGCCGEWKGIARLRCCMSSVLERERETSVSSESTGVKGAELGASGAELTACVLKGQTTVLHAETALLSLIFLCAVHFTEWCPSARPHVSGVGKTRWKRVHEVPTLGVCFAVLTWGGEVSAVSQDAIRDSRWARTATVIDDWDEEFDRGKVWAMLEAGVTWQSQQSH